MGDVDFIMLGPCFPWLECHKFGRVEYEGRWKAAFIDCPFQGIAQKRPFLKDWTCGFGKVYARKIATRKEFLP